MVCNALSRSSKLRQAHLRSTKLQSKLPFCTHKSVILSVKHCSDKLFKNEYKFGFLSAQMLRKQKEIESSYKIIILLPYQSWLSKTRISIFFLFYLIRVLFLLFLSQIIHHESLFEKFISLLASPTLHLK